VGQCGMSYMSSTCEGKSACLSSKRGGIKGIRGIAKPIHERIAHDSIDGAVVSQTEPDISIRGGTVSSTTCLSRCRLNPSLSRQVIRNSPVPNPLHLHRTHPPCSSRVREVDSPRRRQRTVADRRASMGARIHAGRQTSRHTRDGRMEGRGTRPQLVGCKDESLGWCIAHVWRQV